MSRRSITIPLGLGLAFLLGCTRVLADHAPADDGATACSVAATPSCPAACDSCDAGVCHITCAPGSACARETVACAPGMDCDVSCVGDDACKSATIAGPTGFALDVDCRGAASCGGVVVDSGGNVELSCSGAKACERATLRCDVGECDWACANAGSCDGIVVQ